MLKTIPEFEKIRLRFDL